MNRDPAAAARDRTASDWRADVDRVAPTVLVLGGFLTSPPFYRPMRGRLLQRGAAAVVVANVWTVDWLLTGARGLGPIVGRGANAVRVATGIAAASILTRGAPLLVVGHSAGGIVARLLTSEDAFAGRRLGLADAMAGLVTLGSPHHVAPTRPAGRRVATLAARFADRHVPGAAFAPRVGYVTVASRAVHGRAHVSGRERVAFRLYQELLHEPGATGVEGDGLVPVRSALLDGARQIVLDDIMHGQAAGQPWYGTDRGLDGWWAEAVDSWRIALRVRAAEPLEVPEPPGTPGAPDAPAAPDVPPEAAEFARGTDRHPVTYRDA